MIISLIVAMDEARGIGLDGRLPWHLREDLRRFKSLTMGHHIIMGRTTYESIGRILSGRSMIVITRKAKIKAPGCLVVHSVDEAFNLAKSRGETEVFVIGGSQLYAQTLDRADRIYLTQVHTHSDCDVFFPEINLGDWVETEKQYHHEDAYNDFPTTYTILTRNRLTKRFEM